MIACVWIIVVFFSLVGCEPKKGVRAPKHSFAPPYPTTTRGGNIPFWEYGASAYLTESFVRLVPAVQSRRGWLWNTHPFELKNWQARFKFAIHNTQSPGADGMALWLAKDPKQEGSLVGYIPNFQGIGIIFDSYDNNHNGDNPAVILIRNDGKEKEWDIDNDFLADEIERCLSYFRNPVNDNATALITYEGRKLTIEMDTFGKGEFGKCFEVPNFDIPSGYYLGMTALTGGLSDNHDVFSFQVVELDEPVGSEQAEGVHVGLGEEEDGGGGSRTQQRIREHLEKERKKKEKPKIDEAEKAKKEAERKAAEEAKQREMFEKLRERLNSRSGLRPTHTEVTRLDSDEGENKVSEDPDSEIPVEDEDETKTAVVILQALEEVMTTIRHSSTKGDMSQILRRVEGIADSQEEMGDLMMSTMKTLSDGLENESKQLDKEIVKLGDVLGHLKRAVDNMQRQQGSLEQDISESTRDLESRIQTTSKWGVGIWFMIAEVVFLVGFFLVRRFYLDEKKRFL